MKQSVLSMDCAFVFKVKYVPWVCIIEIDWIDDILGQKTIYLHQRKHKKIFVYFTHIHKSQVVLLERWLRKEYQFHCYYLPSFFHVYFSSAVSDTTASVRTWKTCCFIP